MKNKKFIVLYIYIKVTCCNPSASFFTYLFLLFYFTSLGILECVYTKLKYTHTHIV